MVSGGLWEPDLLPPGVTRETALCDGGFSPCSVVQLILQHPGLGCYGLSSGGREIVCWLVFSMAYSPFPYLDECLCFWMLLWHRTYFVFCVQVVLRIHVLRTLGGLSALGYFVRCIVAALSICTVDRAVGLPTV